MTAQRLFRSLLGICPLLISLLWIAGIAQFREFRLEPLEWAALAAIGFALQLLSRRARRHRPLPQLPANANPAAIAGLAATIVGVLVGCLGALFEWFLQSYRPSDVPLALRALWHGACAFAASYCGFLLRLQLALEAQTHASGDNPPDGT